VCGATSAVLQLHSQLHKQLHSQLQKARSLI
jgi:hypothetical protein